MTSLALVLSGGMNFTKDRVKWIILFFPKAVKWLWSGTEEDNE